MAPPYPGVVISKSHPDARHRGLRFRIGNVFRSDDPIARWTTVMSMAINDTVYVNVRIIEGDLPPELNLYYFRLVAAHFFELCTWLADTPSRWPEVEAFLAQLSNDGKTRLADLQSFASQKHPRYRLLSRSRNTLFHYPRMHPQRTQAGVEELATAMYDAADIESTIEGGKEWASFRARFADEIAVQFIGADENEYRALLADLQKPMFSLVELGEEIILAHLKRVDPRAVEVFGTG